MRLTTIRTGVASGTLSASVGSAARIAAFAILPILAASTASAQVPVTHQGEWVAAAGACTAPVRVRVEAARLVFVNGTADSETVGGIEMAGPGYFPLDYRGIMAVAITEFSGDQPVVMTFNTQEKKGVAQADFAKPSPGPGAELARLNAHFTKLNLAKRFPGIDGVLLKKCPAAPPRK